HRPLRGEGAGRAQRLGGGGRRAAHRAHSQPRTLGRAGVGAGTMNGGPAYRVPTAGTPAEAASAAHETATETECDRGRSPRSTKGVDTMRRNTHPRSKPTSLHTRAATSWRAALTAA